MEKPFEQTLVLIKPDALKQSLTGYILSTLSEFHTGLCFSGIKVVRVSRMLAEEHYAEHRGKDFFAGLLEYITGCTHYPEDPDKRRVLAFVYHGPNAIQLIRDIAGPTDPHVAREKKPGCLRALGTIQPLKDENGTVVGDRFDNLIHASDSPVSAEREVKLWFHPKDIPHYMRGWATEPCDGTYCYNDGKLLTTYEPGCDCVLVHGETLWKTDLDALRAHSANAPTDISLESVFAKYLINEKPRNE